MILSAPVVHIVAFHNMSLNSNVPDTFMCLSSMACMIKKQSGTKKKTSTTPSCRGPIPAQKSWGNSVLQGSYFPTRYPKWMFVILIVLVEKKRARLIYHMSWLYQYPPLPFHRSYRNSWTIKLPPLDHGGPEMKCTYFHRNCWKQNSLK